MDLGSDTATVNIYNACQYKEGEDNIPCKTIHELSPEGTALTITVPHDADAMIVVEVKINQLFTKTIFLNKYMIYKAFDKHLSKENCDNKCNSCSDKNWRNKTLSAMLRINLLNYAYENMSFNEAIDRYVDLNRSLDFKDITFESAPDKQ